MSKLRRLISGAVGHTRSGDSRRWWANARRLVLLGTVILLAVLLSHTPFRALAAPDAVSAGRPSSDAAIRTDALVLVNSTSADYADFQHLIQPYLDHFGIPYTVLDIATTPVAANVADYAVIIIGHRQLDLDGTQLSVAEQANISAAVTAGSGLVNFDNDLSGDASHARYQFIQDIFDFSYDAPSTESGVSFTAAAGGHYITTSHQPGTVIGTDDMTLAGITSPADAIDLVTTGAQPFLTVRAAGQGRAVQWGTYDWMSYAVKGPMSGLDDLVWRSIVWAARKPFVMQGLPPLVTMRIDDVSGPFDWIHTANEFGIKPWASLFFHDISDAEATDLAALISAGQATTSIHAFDNNTFFFSNHGPNYSDAQIAANFAEATQWLQAHNLPLSKFALGHYYEIGSNAFQGLSDWGVQFVGLQQDPGQPYHSSPWIMNGPFRTYQAGTSDSILPMYYADFVSVPGHPEFNGQFFNCLTEIRDDAGYEWYPDNTVSDSIGRGTRQTERALDSMALSTLFTHDQYVEAVTPDNWRAILQGITSNLVSYHPQYVTMDYACQYIRAMATSSIASSTYNPETRQVTAYLSGQTDMATKYYLFYDDAGQIQDVLVDVPQFSGAAQVNFTLPVTVIGTSFDRYAGNPLTTIPAYGASGVLHPDVIYFPDGLDGYKYWMMYTPYPPDNMENPNIVRSNDGLTWTDAGISNPVIPDAPAGAWDADYNADPDFIYVPDYHKWFTAWAGWNGTTGERQLGFAYSSDGKTWTPYDGTPVNGNPNPILMSANDTNGQAWEKPSGHSKLTEPSMMYDGSGQFTIYYGEEQEGNNRGKAGFATFGWDDATHSVVNLQRYANNPTIDLPDDGTFQSGFGHRDLSKYDGLYYLYIDRALAGSSAYALELLTSPDKINWTNHGLVLPPGPSGSWDDGWIYRSAPVVDAGGNIVLFNGQMHLYYSAYGNPGIGLATSAVSSQAVDHIVVTPASPTIPTGGSVQFTAQGYDVFNNPVPSLTYLWNVAYGGGTIDRNGLFTAGSTPGTYNNTVTAAYGTAGGAASVIVATPILDHFTFQAIASPQYVGAPFQVTLTARDTNDYLFTGYAGQATMSANVGNLTPGVTGSFSNGSWTGTVTLEQVAGQVVLTAGDGALSGSSNSFAVQAAPQYYQVSSASDSQKVNRPFTLTVTAFQATINGWEDMHQSPVLATTTNSADLKDTDGQWTEFWYQSGRPFPGVFASVNEIGSLPVMRFYANVIPNGQYQVVANLFTSGSGRDMRYFYGFTSDNARAFSVDTVGGSGGTTMFTEYSLGTTTITDNTLNLYTDAGELLSGTYSYFGWAWIRLVPVGNLVTLSSSSPTMLFDGNNNGVFGETGDDVKALAGGTFTSTARDTMAGTDVAVIATDSLAQSGSSSYTIQGLTLPPPPPPLPSSFYGAIHILDNPPSAGTDVVQVTVAGISQAFTTTVRQAGGNTLTYGIHVPGDVSGTAEKEGGIEGDTITFAIGGRTVAVSTWHSGTNTHLDIHPPAAAFTIAGAANEGSSVTLDANSAQDWGSDVASDAFDCNHDGSYETLAAADHTATCTFADNGSYTVGLQVVDQQGGVATTALLVSVANVVPTVIVGTDTALNEGDTFAATGHFTDPGLVDTWTASVDYGDGSGSQALGLNLDRSFALSHPYPDPGHYSLVVTVTDKDGAVGTGSLAVTVNDVLPQANAGGPYAGTVGQPVNLTGVATCVAVDGCVPEWDLNGNGTFGEPGEAGLSVAYTWNEAGDHPVVFRVHDNDGHTATSNATVTITGGPAPITISAGWNLLSLALAPYQTYTAQSLLAEINAQGGNCSEVDRWLNGGWDSHLNGPSNDFPIDGTSGYFFKCAHGSQWSQLGEPNTQASGLSLAAGWNLVSLSYSPVPLTAESLIAGIRAQGGDCNEVDQWLNGGWDSHLSGPSHDFSLVAGQGYFVKCSKSSTYTPGGTGRRPILRASLAATPHRKWDLRPASAERTEA